MKRLLIGCAVVGLIALLPKTEARSSTSLRYFSLCVVPVQHQIGTASWYGDEFEGNETASGEIYDSNGLTAAHQTLPFGTIIRVINLENGKKILLRINDRGPSIGRRLLDVSWAAAKHLGFVGAGTTRVRMEIVSRPTVPTAQP